VIAAAARSLLALPVLLAVPLAVLLGGTAGCGSKSTTILESDVPTPPKFEVRFSEGISRSEGALAEGRFVLSGEVKDLRRLATETAARYTGGGWREIRREIEADRAILVFAKDRRQVEVEIDRRRIQPAMSTAIVTVGASAGAP
jgi:hypothetical protein